MSMKQENQQNFMKMQQNFAKITTQLETLQNEFTSMKTEVADLTYGVEHLDTEVTVIRDETIPDLRKKLQKEIDDLKKARLTAELYSKKSNLLFHGIAERPGEDTESVLRTFLADQVKYDNAHTITFANVHRLPSKNQSDRPNPIIAKFHEMKNRNEILSKAKILKNSTQKFGISPHLPLEMQQARSQLLPIRQQAIQQGKRAFIKITGINVHLYIDNVLYKP